MSSRKGRRERKEAFTGSPIYYSQEYITLQATSVRQNIRSLRYEQLAYSRYQKLRSLHGNVSELDF